MNKKPLITDNGFFTGEEIYDFSLKEPFETISSIFTTLQQYREFTNPDDAIAWADYVHMIFHILGFNTEKLAPRLLSLQEMGTAQTPKALVCIIGPNEDFHQIIYGLEWESYLFFASRYFQTDWVILTNGFQFKVLHYSKDPDKQKSLACQLDEIIKHNKIDNFFSVYKIFAAINHSESYQREKAPDQTGGDGRRHVKSAFSLERGSFGEKELERRLKESMSRKSELTPRFVLLLEILISEDRVFKRDEIKTQLFAKGVGSDISQSGRYLSNLSQFLTKKSNPHLRQVIGFTTSGALGEKKDNYQIFSEYRKLVLRLIDEWKQETLKK